MKLISIIAFLLLTSNLCSQNKLSFSERKKSDKTILISTLAEKIINKDDSIDNLDWSISKHYELQNNLRMYEADIDNSKNKIDYYIDKRILKSEKIIYSIHFYLNENEEQHSKIYFLFKNQNSDIVEEIKIDNKDIIEKMKKEWYKQMGNDTPPPPSPPSKN